jgi:hypothetical protein
MVEHTFRSMKSLLETRPVHHRLDETIRGHVLLQLPRPDAQKGTLPASGGFRTQL